MTVTHRLDPELAGPLEAWHKATKGGINLHDIPAARRTMDELAAAQMAKAQPIEGVSITDRKVPGPAGAPDVFVRIYQPTDRPATLPALLWIHGGGYVLGSVERDDLLAKHLAKVGQCVVASVEYRLAPEHPFPAPVEDCYAALKWLAAQSAEFGVNTSRIAIGGASAGSGLAAGLALLTRDRAEVELAFQLLIYPMIDDRNIAPANATVPDTLVWTRENNLMGWRALLGCEPGGADVSPYAAASRATDLKGLPPAYIPVGDLDLFLDENITYAQRLLAAGVPTELHVYPGAFHGFNGFVPGAAISRRFNAERDNTLKRMLHR
ncbi:MAG: alpha/beta hydrolase [Deltaproteobacteria bacterium]|nr:alpha/beta hydrolase [Deltaproteobacteria bacterium]